MWLRLTERAKKAVAFAQSDARLSPDLILLACLREEGGVVARMLANLGLDAAELRARVEAVDPDPGTESDEIIELAEEEAHSASSPYIGSEHLLLGIIRKGECESAKIIIDAGADYDSIAKALDDIRARKDKNGETND